MTECAWCSKDISKQRTVHVAGVGWIPKGIEFCSESCVDTALFKWDWDKEVLDEV